MGRIKVGYSAFPSRSRSSLRKTVTSAFAQQVSPVPRSVTGRDAPLG